MKAEILILGMLHRETMHPYEIKRRLKAAQVESYIGIDVGTLYYAIRQLVKDGLIEERGRENTGRGERTIYGITPEGRARFQTLMTETLGHNGPLDHPLYPALIFLHQANRDDMSKGVETRLEALVRFHSATRAILRQTGDVIATGLRLMMENSVAHQETEINWTRHLLAELQDGDINAGIRGPQAHPTDESKT